MLFPLRRFVLLPRAFFSFFYSSFYEAKKSLKATETSLVAFYISYSQQNRRRRRRRRTLTSIACPTIYKIYFTFTFANFQSKFYQTENFCINIEQSFFISISI